MSDIEYVVEERDGLARVENPHKLKEPVGKEFRKCVALENLTLMTPGY